MVRPVERCATSTAFWTTGVSGWKVSMSSVGRVAPYASAAAAPPMTRIDAGSGSAASIASTKRSSSWGGWRTEGLSGEGLEAVERHVHQEPPSPSDGWRVDRSQLLPDQALLGALEEEGVRRRPIPP